MALNKNPILDVFNCYIIGYECKKKEIKIIMCEKDQADNIIINNHYSNKPTKNSFLNFLVYYKNKAKGALQIGYGIRPDINNGYNKDEIVEFDRMWLSDEMPKFSETITISLLHNFLKKRYKNLKYIYQLKHKYK